MKNRISVGSRTAVGTLVALVVAIAAPLVSNAETPELSPATNADRISIAPRPAGRTPENVIAQWPETARLIAETMLSQYGEPLSYSDDGLLWRNNGPWIKTVVYREALPHFILRRDKDYLEQTIAYTVPEDKIDALERFDGRLRVGPEEHRLSSRSESERMNYLALNLADDIVCGKRSVSDARDFYFKTAELARAGKSSPYLNGLMFSTVAEPTAPLEYR